MLSEAEVTERLRMMGAPLFGSLERKRERLSRLEHYAFKRVINEQITLATIALLKLKTDSRGPDEIVSVPTTNGHHGYPSLH
jgi:hypothetical protein